MNVPQIRADFPILSEKIYGKPLIYFDNAATTQKPRQVVEKLVNGYYKHNANIHRGVHFLSQEATEAHEAARRTIQQFINARSPKEIVFTRGTTEAINLVAFSFGESFCKAGDEILISAMEHHSNIVPWQMLGERKGMKLQVVSFDENGELNIEELKSKLSERTKLVAITHVSNALGTINPVKEIIRIAHENNVPVLIDGAQSVQHIKIDVQDLDADFFVFSGHKIYAPTGIGALYGKEQWLERMVPYQGGGEMISKVSFEKTTYNELPFKFEAGTPDFIGSTAFAEAIRFVQNIGIENIARYETELLQYATERLLTIKNLRIIGTAQEKCSLISFLVGDIHPYDIGTILDKLGIAVRTGHHCAQPVMDAFDIEGTVRASFALYNTKEEIDALVAGVERARKMFRQ